MHLVRYKSVMNHKSSDLLHSGSQGKYSTWCILNPVLACAIPAVHSEQHIDLYSW